MRLSRSRRIAWPVAVFIVMLGAAVPQRVFAQWRAELLPGLRFGPPMRAGFALGVGYGARLGPAQFAGPLVLGEVGVGGGRVSAGLLFAGPFASGIELLGSAIRTWGSPSQLERGVTIAGGEVRASFFLVNVGLGVFRPVSGFEETDRRTRYYLNVGLGI
jgi:hypothetical protein